MNILIVDDNPIKATTIINSLEYLQADIKVITKGHAALMEILESDFDYLISDMQFPWKGSVIENDCGLHLQKEMEESGIKLKTIICSSIKVDVQYPNVIGYIIYQGHDMEEKFKEYIN